MKRQLIAFAIVAAALPISTGCAADELEGSQVAYPQPIGYTPPPTAPAAPNGLVPTDPQGGSDEQEPPGPSTAPGGGEVGGDDGYADSDPSALSDFRPALDPYGSWVDDPTYGTVWVPYESAVGSDFTPYLTAGHWAYGDDYVWMSDYPWGWAPFHYGRWVYAGEPGWAWVPGRRYAGAWVSWRVGQGERGYVGWAPLTPTWRWHGGAAMGLGFVPTSPYSFVPSREVFAGAPSTRVVAGPEVGVIASHTQAWIPARPGVGVAAGPPPTVLHIPEANVVHTPGANVGLMRAQAFARPASAVALGARAPSVTAVSRTLGRPVAEPSHFGGRLLGAGFTGVGARPYVSSPWSARGPGGSTRYPTTTLGRGGYSSPAYSGGARYAGPQAGSFHAYSAARPSSAPSFHSSAPSAGAFHSGGGGGSGGGRGGGSRGGGGRR
jgi:hypothetical protein